jgi:flagellar hook assembly protein FlgD
VWIPYRLNVENDITITIYNISGQAVRTLNIGRRPAGIYENKPLAAHWDGKNTNGETVNSGIYFYHLKAADFSAVRKMVIIK